jgi:O-antigen ligase
MMVLLGGRARRVGVVALMTIGAALILGFISHQSVYRLVMFATRGERGAVLEAMSGRGVIYRNAWAAIKAAPILGYGPQADRQFGAIGNAQDGLLYALLCGGFIGGSAWFAGLVMAWLYLWRIAARMQGMPEGDRRTLTEVAGMMMFFTLRSIPENCAALFSVDLMVQLPAVVYLGVLHRELNASRARLRRPANVRAAAPRIAATVRCASVQ